MLGVVARAEQSQFFAEQATKTMLRLGRLGKRRQGMGYLDYGSRAAGVVVGAVVDVVALAGAADSQVIVVAGDQHIGVLQRRVRPAQHADHVAKLDRRQGGSRDARRNTQLRGTGVVECLAKRFVPHHQHGERRLPRRRAIAQRRSGFVRWGEPAGITTRAGRSLVRIDAKRAAGRSATAARWYRAGASRQSTLCRGPAPAVRASRRSVSAAARPSPPQSC